MTDYVQMKDKTYDLQEGNLVTNHPDENGIWSAEALLCDIERELKSNSSVNISRVTTKKDSTSQPLMGVFYHNRLIMMNDESDHAERFEIVHLDYWACVEMHAESKRNKNVTMPLNFLSSDRDNEKEKDFLEDMWAGKIPYLEVRPLLKPCPFCGGEPFEHHHFEQRTCNSYVSIECRSCGATVKKSHGPGEDCRKSATIRVHNIWNKRC